MRKERSFEVGEFVVHRTNPRQKMMVINVLNKIECRWLDFRGTPYERKFLPEELKQFNCRNFLEPIIQD